MDIDNRGSKRFVAHQFLDRQDIGAVLVKVGTEGVTEGMAGQMMFPSELILMFTDMTCQIERVDRGLVIVLFWKEPPARLSTGKPVFGKDFQRTVWKDCITV